jgi:hypothetical protein
MLRKYSRIKYPLLASLILAGFAMGMDSAVAGPRGRGNPPPGFSNKPDTRPGNTKVPEVDIGSGGYALALLSGGLLFLGEKRRSAPRK